MRVQIAIQSDHIFKTVSSSSGYYEWVCEELDTYRRWIEKVGFSTLKTEITYNPDTSQMTFMQIYLEGQSAPDYKLIYSKLLHLQLDHFGLDANPDNFIFTHNEIYFIDYHPILIKDHPHSHSHFAYPANLINKRYHDIDGAVS